jgi:hypothetical protein
MRAILRSRGCEPVAGLLLIPSTVTAMDAASRVLAQALPAGVADRYALWLDNIRVFDR